MVDEQIIDEVTEELSSSENAFEHALKMMNDRQPRLLAYLFSEEFDAFTQEEREYLLFLAVVIWKSVYRLLGDQPLVSESQISEAEENNWLLLQANNARRFQDRLNAFFEQSTEEDLLSFVEDALSEDEESPVTREGREAIFITLKSIIDCLTA